MLRSPIEAASRPTAEAKLQDLAKMHHQLRTTADNLRFDHADPSVEPEALMSGATLLVGFATGLRRHHIREIPEGLPEEVSALAEEARRAMSGQPTEVTLSSWSGARTRKLKLPRDPGKLVEILTPRISKMGLPACTVYERGEIFNLLHTKYFPPST